MSTGGRQDDDEQDGGGSADASEASAASNAGTATSGTDTTGADTDTTTAGTGTGPLRRRRVQLALIGGALALAAVVAVSAAVLDGLSASDQPMGVGRAGAPDQGYSPRPTEAAEVPVATATPVTLPPSQPLAPLVSLPLPKSATGDGVVDGFPSGVLPVAPDSTVTSTSLTSEGDRLQATLAAQTTGSLDDVTAFYRQAFTALGMLESDSPAVGGSTALRYGRGTDTITLTMTPGDAGTVYTLVGNFTATS